VTVHLVCYADARFHHARQRLVKSALVHGVDQVHAFGPADIQGTEFFRCHAGMLNQQRGGGYWLWKPYLIRRVLGEARPGDLVLYVDSGAEITAPVAGLADVCRNAGGILIFRNHERKNRYWTKRDCYVLMECDTEACYAADQANAAFAGFIAGQDAESFVDDWLTNCTDPRVLTDAPNECGLPDLPDFIEHRHDQSVLSLLAFKKGLYLYRDPSQSGNHQKLPEARVPEEYLDLPYAAQPCERSTYPTLFEHHRVTTAPPTVAKRSVAWAKAKVREWVPKTWMNPYFGPDDVADSIAVNRRTLGEVKKWFDPAADAKSQFGYGVPPSVRHLLDRSVGSQPTVPDLIGHLAESFGDQLNYLEIGVSVGKNFYQLLRAGKGRILTGFDIEEIHPNLSSKLTLESGEEWPPSPGSMKRPPSSLTNFVDRSRGNRVRYLAADVFDAACWERLRGKPFNFIFSDALHRPEGLMHEWRMIERYDLLDRNEFVMLWDDLGGIMSVAFDRIAHQIQALAGPCVKLTFPMRGWLGVNEYPHQIGMVAKLRNPPNWLHKAAASFQAVPTVVVPQPNHKEDGQC
jgi:predicted DNA-binding transcriptional regulator AlpA